MVGDEGFNSVDALEAKHGVLVPALTTPTRWGSTNLWFNGSAMSSHNLLGRGLHVYGPGTFIYLPASLAPLPIE
jgi:hypothetical protein